MKDKRFQKIYVEITNTCNLKCSFCLEGKREKRFMSVDEFKKVILKIQDYTNLITLHVKGEPLLHPNLKEILEIFKKNLVNKDIAVTVDKNITSDEVAKVIKKAAGNLLVSSKLFDVYTSEALGDKKSMAYSLTFGSNSKTLTDDEINDIFSFSVFVVALVEESKFPKRNSISSSKFNIVNSKVTVWYVLDLIE